MKMFQRGVGFLVLLALLTHVTILTAQDEADLTAVGSGIVAPLFDALVNASEIEGVPSVDITGTDAGFAAFCEGSASMTVSNRPMTSEEDANCIANDITYAEILLGHNIIAFITHPDLDIVDLCITTDQVNTLLTPSSAGQITTWDQLGVLAPVEAGTEDSEAEEAEDPVETPLTVILPQLNTLAYFTVDAQTDGDGLRGDATQLESETDIIAAVAEQTGALGIVTYSESLFDNEDIQVLGIQTANGGCVDPSAENVESRLYPYSQRLFLYVDRAALENPTASDFLDYIASDTTAEVVEQSGFIAPSLDAYEDNRLSLSGENLGRQFSQDVVEFSIAPDVFGQVAIGGAANIYPYLSGATQAFTSQYTGVTIDLNIEGEAAGIRRLCNGEIAIAAVTGTPTDERFENCTANDIETVAFPMGTQATILVANAEDTFATCLSLDHIATIWGASEGDPVNNWQDLDESFPDLSIMLFGMSSTSPMSDLLLKRPDGQALPLRTDAFPDDIPSSNMNNALWRAAATANVSGSLTYMSWNDYQRVLDNDQQNIQVISVDDGTGAGCIAPSEETIITGEYALSLPTFLVVNQEALLDEAVKSVLWYLYADQNVSRLASLNFSEININDAANIRVELQRAFTLADEAMFTDEADAEITPEPGAESTAEPGAETTPEATEESGE